MYACILFLHILLLKECEVAADLLFVQRVVSLSSLGWLFARLIVAVPLDSGIFFIWLTFESFLS